MTPHVFLLAGQFPGTTAAASLAAALEYGQLAERVGFDGAWIAEHHFIPYGVCPSAPAFAANLLGRTSRLLVGTAACIMSNRHPVAVGEEAALLDELSGGRFALGVARGGPWVDLEVFGTGLDRFEHGFAESLDVLLAWLSGRPVVGWTGEHHRFRPVDVVPRPRRRVPVYVAATSPHTVETAAARGLPLLLGMHATDQEKLKLLREYGRVAAVHGHDPDAVEHASAHLAYVADTDAEAVRLVREPIVGLLGQTAAYVRLDGGGPGRDAAAYAEHLLAIHPVGSPERCRERLAESTGTTGVRHVLLMVEGAGDPARTSENMARLAAEVTGAS